MQNAKQTASVGSGLSFSSVNVTQQIAHVPFFRQQYAIVSASRHSSSLTTLDPILSAERVYADTFRTLLGFRAVVS